MEKPSNHIKNITGKVFGRLTVIEYVGVHKDKRAYWKCQCNCGNIITARGSSLIQGTKLSCGCLQKEKCRLARIDFSLIGKRHGKLTALGITENEAGNIRIRYKCDCGNIFLEKSWLLTSNKYTSCGCSHHAPRRDNKEAMLQKLFTTYKRTASIGNKDFHLTKEQFIEITQQPCTYCGEREYRTPDNTHNRRNGKYAEHYKKEQITGVDRIDSSKGYCIDNVTPCCAMCNLMKNKFHKDLWLSQIEKIYKHINNK